ncbi:MAG TPA: glycosyltransferase [Planctomycetota bacterium]|nr:glycosyltransferase [Planctomycetota bacterium]
MRVCVFSHSYVVAANHAKLERLARAPGVELSLICPRRIRREFGVYPVQRTHHSDYQIVPLRAVYSSHNYRFFYLGAARALRCLNPDILHIEEEPWSLAAWQAIRHRRGRPDLKIVFFTWQNLRQRHGFPHDQIERAVHAAADAAIAGNAEAADILREKGFAKRVHILPQFGVDETVYTKRDETLLRKELGLHGFVVGFAGRLVPEKGLDTLIGAAPQFEGDWNLLVVGGGPLRAQMARRVAQPPLAGRAVLLDTVPHAEMPRYLSCMDALVLPSRTAPRWKEQFGHVLIEAMACEVPVVGSTSGEIPGVIGDAGLTFPEGDATALGDALRRLMASREMRSDLAARGRRRVLDCYTDARIAQATFDIWREVMGR